MLNCSTFGDKPFSEAAAGEFDMGYVGNALSWGGWVGYTFAKPSSGMTNQGVVEMAFKTDIEIAREAKKRPIMEIGE